MSRAEKSPYLSVVVPAYNEAENLEPLCSAIQEYLQPLGYSYELILVDDGSTDETVHLVRSLCQRYPFLKVIRLRRNFGQTAALSAGFHYAQGQIVIAMDADLQYHPEDIPALLEKIEEGYDIASGWRKNRKDPFLRKFPSFVANRIIRWLSGVPLHDFGSTFKAYRREILEEINLYGEMHRFIPALAASIGARIIEVPVHLYPRERGQSKYGLGRTWRVLLDIIAVKFLISYSRQPLRFFGLIGLLLGGAGFGILGILTFRKFFQGIPYAHHEPLLFLGILLMILGVQFISLGLITELVVRTYYESQGKPIYSVKEILSSESLSRGEPSSQGMGKRPKVET